MTTSKPCLLYLVRHGETEWNRNGRWQGQTDIPLSAAGRAQAARLACRLQELNLCFDALYSSDLSRAWETATILGGTLGLSPAAAPALREIDLGVWSGLTVVDIAERFPSDWARLEAGEDIARGGAETFAVFLSRIRNWINGIAIEHPGRTVCAVTHGGCIRAALLAGRGLAWADRRVIPAIANASISVLRISSQGWVEEEVNQTPSACDQPPLTDNDEGKIV